MKERDLVSTYYCNYYEDLVDRIGFLRTHIIRYGTVGTNGTVHCTSTYDIGTVPDSSNLTTFTQIGIHIGVGIVSPLIINDLLQKQKTVKNPGKASIEIGKNMGLSNILSVGQCLGTCSMK
jgi:hypothetical protein